eukprot:1159538-Pelagomonas_calceolata.AAC.6
MALHFPPKVGHEQSSNSCQLEVYTLCACEFQDAKHIIVKVRKKALKLEGIEHDVRCTYPLAGIKGVREFEDQPARNGVYCQLLGEQVEVLGEKGTKLCSTVLFTLKYPAIRYCAVHIDVSGHPTLCCVPDINVKELMTEFEVPDINVKELMIEIELVANTLLEWTPAEGWKVGEVDLAFIPLAQAQLLLLKCIGGLFAPMFGVECQERTDCKVQVQSCSSLCVVCAKTTSAVHASTHTHARMYTHTHTDMYMYAYVKHT